jgi:citrate synthase
LDIMTDAAVNPLKAGLEDVVVSPSEICFIDGHKGRLIYRGYDVDDLVAHSTFEEVTFLLWQGRLPSRKELDAHLKALASTANRKLPPKLLAMLKMFPKKTTPMEVLRTGVSALSAFDPDAADNSREATLRKSLRLTAQLPTLVAAWERIRRGKAPVAPNPRLNLAGNFLYMMSGKKPTPLATKTFDIALILHADHEFNASTFAARVVASTGANLYGATMAGLAALNGPRHGGLTRRVASLFDDLKNARDLDGELVQRVRDRIYIPGFGHQLYPDGDVRAATLFALLREAVPNAPELAFAERLAAAGERLIDRKPNVDFTTVVVERVLGLPKDSALALFLLGRTVGWIAHALEQSAHAALIRPRARYTGPRPGG